MRLIKPSQCSAIVEPGEYTINTWDGTKCTEKNPGMLTVCPDCNEQFCLIHHWPLHFKKGCSNAQN